MSDTSFMPFLSGPAFRNTHFRTPKKVGCQRAQSRGRNFPSTFSFTVSKLTFLYASLVLYLLFLPSAFVARLFGCALQAKQCLDYFAVS